MRTILGVKLNGRNKNAVLFQEILSKYGCIIRTRIGLHEVEDGKCSPSGVVLLEVIDDEELIAFQKELCQIEDIEIQQMSFSRD